MRSVHLIERSRSLVTTAAAAALLFVCLASLTVSFSVTAFSVPPLSSRHTRCYYRQSTTTTTTIPSAPFSRSIVSIGSKPPSSLLSSDEEAPVVVLLAGDEPNGVVATPVIAPLEQRGPTSKWRRLRNALPGIRQQEGSSSTTLPALNNKGKRSSLLAPIDKVILSTSIPSMINLAVVPIVNSVDTFWVGRMGNALALAGQAAANQAFFTIFFLVNYLPTITAPLVAKAVGSGNKQEAQQRVCESIFLSNLFGGLGTILLVGFPATALGMILPKGAPALEYATPYLALRALSMIPALFSATGFATFRGLLDTVTPLKVSLGTNLLNLVLDPLLIFASPLGFVGAALATALSEAASGLVYLRLLLKKKLVTPALILRPPSWHSLKPLLLGGASMLGRQLALNIGLVSAARRAQSMDPTGVSAAAYGIVMQMYSIGIVIHVAMQGAAAALIPSTLARSGQDEARRVADRIFIWNSIVGVILGVTQFLAVPFLVPVFSTLPEVQQAVRVPALLSAILHVINGPVFAGEGALLGLGCYRDLMLITAAGIGVMVACLSSPLGKRLDGILLSLMAFCAFQAVAVVIHYLKIGPLAVKKRRKGDEAAVSVSV